MSSDFMLVFSRMPFPRRSIRRLFSLRFTSSSLRRVLFFAGPASKAWHSSSERSLKTTFSVSSLKVLLLSLTEKVSKLAFSPKALMRRARCLDWAKLLPVYAIR